MLQNYNVDAWHGSPRDIPRFKDTYSTSEGYYGPNHYFSSSVDDVDANYATPHGADIVNRTQQQGEMLQQNGIEDYEMLEALQNLGHDFPSIGDVPDHLVEEAMQKIVRDSIGITNDGTMYPVKLRMANPVRVGGLNQTKFDYHHPYDEDTDTWGEPSGNLLNLIHGLRQNATYHGIDDKVLNKAIDEIIYDADSGYIAASDFERHLRKLSFDYDADGNLTSPGALIADAYRTAGYDSIDMDAYSAFGPRRGFMGAKVPGMSGIYPDTRHYIKLDPTGIRSRFAKFDPEQIDSTDIDKAAGGRIAKGGAGAVLGVTETLLKKLANQSPDMAARIRAYHGSPYDFEKFDLSKIGTGEGAQAYGHGLYFADREGVARSYRDKLSDPNAPLGSFKSDNGQELNIFDAPDGFHSLLGEYPDNTSYEKLLEAANDKLQWAQTRKGPMRDILAKKGQEVVDFVNANKGVRFERNPDRGRMYEVDINANPEHLLDWDKPFVKQSDAVRNALEGSSLFKSQSYTKPNDPELFGRTLYDDFVIELEDKKNVSDALRNLGIPGIRYLDGSSRSAGEGTSNYVIFDPSIIDITRKYSAGGSVDQDADIEAALYTARQNFDGGGSAFPLSISGGGSLAPIDDEFVQGYGGGAGGRLGLKIPVRGGMLDTGVSGSVSGYDMDTPEGRMRDIEGDIGGGDISYSRNGRTYGASYSEQPNSRGDTDRTIMLNYSMPFADGGRVGYGTRGRVVTGALKSAKEFLFPKAAEAAGLTPREAGEEFSKILRPYEDWRYKYEDIPRGTPSRAFDPNILKPGDVFVPLFGDRTSAGRKIYEINGNPLAEPIVTEGGPQYMLNQQGQIWASGKPIISGLANKAEAALQASEKAGYKDPSAYGIYVPMGRRSGDFSTHTAETILGMLPSAKITKQSADLFDETMKAKLPDFPGINSPELPNYLLSPGAGKKRIVFSQTMDAKDWKLAGFPDVGVARMATTDPRLITTPDYHGGYMVGKIDRSNPVMATPDLDHRSYPVALKGEYVGSIPEGIHKDLIFPNWTDYYNRVMNPERANYGPAKYKSYANVMAYQPFGPRTLENFQELIRKGSGRADGGRIAKGGGGKLIGEALEAAIRLARKEAANSDPMKIIEGGLGEAIPTTTSAARAAENAKAIETAKRLGYDPSNVKDVREAQDLQNFYTKFKGDIADKAKTQSDLVRQYIEEGKFPMEVGTRYQTSKGMEQGAMPWEVTGYYIDHKDPAGRYGYYVRRGDEESSMHMIRDPKLEQLHGPEKWEQLQSDRIPMFGPRVVKAYGGAVDDADIEAAMMIAQRDHKAGGGGIATVRSYQEPEDSSIYGDLPELPYDQDKSFNTGEQVRSLYDAYMPNAVKQYVDAMATVAGNPAAFSPMGQAITEARGAAPEITPYTGGDLGGTFMDFSAGPMINVGVNTTTGRPSQTEDYIDAALNLGGGALLAKGLPYVKPALNAGYRGIKAMLPATAGVAGLTAGSEDAEAGIIGEGLAKGSSALMDALNIAKKMHEEGASVDEIWNATKWYKTPDVKGADYYDQLPDMMNYPDEGSWKTYLDPKNAQFDTTLSDQPQALADVLDFPELYNLSPELKDTIKIVTGRPNFEGGAYNPKTRTINIGDVSKTFYSPGGIDPYQNTAAHELEHAIQHAGAGWRDEWYNGTNRDLALENARSSARVWDIGKKFGHRVSKDPNMQDKLYFANPGEEEARNASYRFSLPALRDKPIPLTSDMSVPLITPTSMYGPMDYQLLNISNWEPFEFYSIKGGNPVLNINKRGYTYPEDYIPPARKKPNEP
jgi:hypothetical protein